MAVVKMKYMNIMADIDMFDEVVDNYLSRYDVEYENAMAENPKMSGLSPISYTSRYVDVLKMAESLNLPETPIDAGQMATDEAVRLINAIYQKQKDVKEQRAALLERKQQFGEFMEQAQTLFGIELDFTRLYNMEYVKFRYGRMPVDSQRKLELYIEKNLNAVFVPGAVKNGYVYGIYLMPATCEEKVDAVFFSLHFERIRLLDELSGSPEEAYAKAEDEIVEIDRQIFALSEAVDKFIAEYGEKAHMAYQKIKDMNARYCLRKFAAENRKRACGFGFHFVRLDDRIRREGPGKAGFKKRARYVRD